MRIQRSVILGIGALLFVAVLGFVVAFRGGLSNNDSDDAAGVNGVVVDAGDNETLIPTTLQSGSDSSPISNSSDGDESLAFGDNSTRLDQASLGLGYGDILTGAEDAVVQPSRSASPTSADSTTTTTPDDSTSTSTTVTSKTSQTTSTSGTPTGQSDTTKNSTTTKAPSTQTPTTKAPTTKAPTTAAPSTQAPTTKAPTTQAPTTQAPTTAPPSGVGSCASGAEFERTFRDDFGGSSVNQSNWTIYNSAGNAGNGLRRPSAMSVANGLLTITASNQGGQVVSGGMAHRGSQQYGRYSFRVRTDVDPSKTMSGVILTWPASQAHPRDGENNIYETLPHEESATRNPFYSFIHKPYGSTSDQVRFVHRADASQWQTLTMEWTPSRVVVTVQGLGSQTVTETSADLIPDNPHIFTVQFDAFKPQIANNLAMQVDWVEIYKYCG